MGGTKRFLHGDEMKKCGHKPMLTPNIGAIATKASKGRALTKYWVTVNPISTRGADYAHHSTMGLVWLKFAVVPLIHSYVS